MSIQISNHMQDIDGAFIGENNYQGQERLGLLSGNPVPRDEAVRRGTSWFTASFIVVNAALGAGLLNFPAAFNAAGGVVVAIVVQGVLMVFIVGALVVLAYCSDVNQNSTYQDVIYSMCGKRAQVLCSITIIVYCFGTCITFCIIIGDQWDKLLYKIFGATFCHHWYMNRQFTMSVSSVLLILPLCFPRRIDFLKYASTLGVIGILYVVLLVTVKYFVGPICPGPIKTSPTEWTDVFLVVPVICFGYQCHISVIPIYACLAKRTLPEFAKTLTMAMIICVGSYTIPAVFGYLTFGSKVASDILVSYSPDPPVLVAVIMIAAKTYTTYPILLFVGRAGLDSLWVDMMRLSPERIVDGERRRRIIMTLCWFTSSVLMAVFIPDIGIVISVLGSLAALFILVFPGLCLLQVLLKGYIDPIDYKHRYRALFVMAVMYLIIGAFIFGVTITQALWTDVTMGSVQTGASSTSTSQGVCPGATDEQDTCHHH